MWGTCNFLREYPVDPAPYVESIKYLSYGITLASLPKINWPYVCWFISWFPTLPQRDKTTPATHDNLNLPYLQLNKSWNLVP